jgi:putative spermidine/putrescine transport system permease protein/spermidine/putrescine transport system permease protein
MMRLSKSALSALSAMTATVFMLLYGPLLIPILVVIHHRAWRVQWSDPSLSAYAALAVNKGILEAFGNTLIVGFSATLLALVCGTLLALHYCGGRSAAREVMQFAVFLPFLMPPIITGLALLIFFPDRHCALAHDRDRRPYGLRPGARLSHHRGAASVHGPGMIEASTDLGASAWQTLIHSHSAELAQHADWRRDLFRIVLGDET